MRRIDIRADYATARKAAYPDIGEQLDAIHKTLAAMLQREPVPDEALAVLQKVQTIKATFPKPAK